MAKITKDMMINDIVTEYPVLIEYIMDYGLHCIGCAASPFETLEEGFLGHGMSPEEIIDIVEKLNKVVEDKKQ